MTKLRGFRVRLEELDSGGYSLLFAYRTSAGMLVMIGGIDLPAK